MGMDVTLVKLGGSLITDKHAPDTARPGVIRRLAHDLARAQREGHRLVVGHGSGSFGHPEARRAGLAGHLGRAAARPDAVPAGVAAGGAAGGKASEQGRPVEDASSTHAISGAVAGPRPAPGPEPRDVGLVQRKAGELHRLVLDALLDAGASPFSIPPSAVAVSWDGRIEHFHAETVRSALERDLMPVVYGDVVLDRVRGASICSTESALRAVADTLRAVGWVVRRCLWLGATPGVLSADGDVLERIAVADADVLLDAAAGAAAPDVTGGMRHRVDAALGMARAGIPSWIGDGGEADVLGRLLAGEAVPGTLVVP